MLLLTLTCSSSCYRKLFFLHFSRITQISSTDRSHVHPLLTWATQHFSLLHNGGTCSGNAGENTSCCPAEEEQALLGAMHPGQKMTVLTGTHRTLRFLSLPSSNSKYAFLDRWSALSNYAQKKKLSNPSFMMCFESSSLVLLAVAICDTNGSLKIQKLEEVE